MSHMSATLSASPTQPHPVYGDRYGANGACAHAGYDPPGAYMCSVHGGMHGGDYDAVTGKWTCPGCTNGCEYFTHLRSRSPLCCHHAPCVDAGGGRSLCTLCRLQGVIFVLSCDASNSRDSGTRSCLRLPMCCQHASCISVEGCAPDAARRL
jgi:hypothetical protein